MYIVRFLLYSNTMKKILGFDIHKLQLILYNDRSPNEEPHIRRAVETYARRRDPRQPNPGPHKATPLGRVPLGLGRESSGAPECLSREFRPREIRGN